MNIKKFLKKLLKYFETMVKVNQKIISKFKSSTHK